MEGKTHGAIETFVRNQQQTPPHVLMNTELLRLMHCLLPSCQVYSKWWQAMALMLNDSTSPGTRAGLAVSLIACLEPRLLNTTCYRPKLGSRQCYTSYLST